MAKKKPEPVALPKRVTSFLIGSETYTEGDPLQIIAPELGVIVPDKWRFESYSKFGLVTFDLGLVRTPLPCRMNEGEKGYNAIMSLTATRFEGVGGFPCCHYENRLHLVYFCGCRHGTHNEVMIWYDQVSFHKGVVQAHAIGRDKYRAPHNHPLVEGYEHLKPVAVEAPVTRQPIIKPGTQIQLF